ASRWKSGLLMWRRAFSTTSESPETWFLMSCSTKLESRWSDSSWRVSASCSACRANHSAEAICRHIASRNSRSSAEYDSSVRLAAIHSTPMTRSPTMSGAASAAPGRAGGAGPERADRVAIPGRHRDQVGVLGDRLEVDRHAGPLQLLQERILGREPRGHLGRTVDAHKTAARLVGQIKRRPLR